MEVYSLIHVSSITYANAAKRILAENGIYAQIQKAPAAVSQTGCGFCLKISTDNLRKSVSLLTSKGFEIKGVYEVTNNGEIERV